MQPPSVPAGPPAKITVGIDLEAIFRGYPVDGETCEIFGVGPVSVEAVRQLMAGNPFIAAVLRKGKQVMGVAHLGRGANAHQATALQWTMPACTVDGCPSQAHLQNDHNVPFASCRETELGNLDPLCTFHHNLKTTRGWSLVAGTGKRAFVPHDDHRHPRSRHVA